MEVEEAPRPLAIALENANNVFVANPKGAVTEFRKLIFELAPMAITPGAEDDLKDLETAIYKLGNVYIKINDMTALVGLVKEIRPLFEMYPKARTAKIVRSLIDMVSRQMGEEPTAVLSDLCLDSIEWARSEKRTFLRHRVETRLCAIYVDLRKYEKAIDLLAGLLKEVKALDDKLLLVEIHLVETRANFNCDNLPKAKASLTAGKTNANAIHCPPLLQAEIDLWSGIVSLRENDPRTAFSYLYESFEAFNLNKDESTHNASDYCYKRALQSLRCQLLCRIMQGDPQACKTIAQSKSMLNYQAHESVQAILKIAIAYEDRSLKKLEQVLADNRALVDDSVVQHHLKDLYDTFLEQNLLKILEPFSVVELAHVAELIELDQDRTTMKLSQMILDQKLLGTLDEGNGNLILYPASDLRPTCASILETIRNSSQCVDSLALLSKTIN